MPAITLLDREKAKSLLRAWGFVSNQDSRSLSAESTLYQVSKNLNLTQETRDDMIKDMEEQEAEHGEWMDIEDQPKSIRSDGYFTDRVKHMLLKELQASMQSYTFPHPTAVASGDTVTVSYTTTLS